MINPDLLKFWSSIVIGIAIASLLAWLISASHLVWALLVTSGAIIGFALGVAGRKRSY